jgi:DNA (cytosine-5)-methyltransferase 1
MANRYPAKLKAISLYTGIGGLDFGFEAAGFETRAAVEFNSFCCKAIRENRPEWGVIEGDIHDVTSDQIANVGNLIPGEADILFGGPPCQPFSKSSYWVSGDTKRLDDPRADTLTAYLRVLRDLRPRTFLLENVYGLAYKGKDEGLKHILDGIDQVNREAGTNYSVDWKMLNAAHFGVPQLRERVFLVGSRDGTRFQFPDATHSAGEHQDDMFVGKQPYMTAWDAIGDLTAFPNEASLTVGGRWGDLLPTIPEGKNYLWHTSRSGGLPLFGWRTRYWSFLLKLAKDQPSWTIQAQPGSAIGPFHWSSRKLTSREMCRIQTFPDDLTFSCGRTEVQRMLGNAVPSLLAEVIAREIRRQLLAEPMDGALALMPERRTPVPPPEKITSVPAQYLGLIGDHPDHPGTGKSAKAKARSASVQAAQLIAAE